MARDNNTLASAGCRSDIEGPGVPPVEAEEVGRMIGYWHAIPPDQSRLVRVSLGARVGGHELVVERCTGESCWHWAVMSNLGHEIERGTAPDAHAAEVMAEEAALHIHPPSPWDRVGRFL
jgi:hypothetical protein